MKVRLSSESSQAFDIIIRFQNIKLLF